MQGQFHTHRGSLQHGHPHRLDPARQAHAFPSPTLQGALPVAPANPQSDAQSNEGLHLAKKMKNKKQHTGKKAMQVLVPLLGILQQP